MYKLIFSGHMESLIKNPSSVSVKFEPEFLMLISCVLNLFSAVTWNSINFDHPSVGILGIPKFMLISWFLNLRKRYIFNYRHLTANSGLRSIYYGLLAT